jgi:ADP-ribosyl-[dinitrogen reductase] hydrolase
VLSRDALENVTWDRSVAKVLELVRAWPRGDGTAAAIESAAKAATSNAPSRTTVGALGKGWVGEEALAIGLYAAMTARTFEECIEMAANHDGDSDSTASIAGQLWGARHGIAALPADAVRRLDVIEPLLDVFREWEERAIDAKDLACRSPAALCR